jgi:hypothetical protein
MKRNLPVIFLLSYSHFLGSRAKVKIQAPLEPFLDILVVRWDIEKPLILLWNEVVLPSPRFIIFVHPILLLVVRKTNQ